MIYLVYFLAGVIVGLLAVLAACVAYDLLRNKQMANLTDLNNALTGATNAVTDLQAKAANLDTSAGIDFTPQVNELQTLTTNITTVANALPQKPTA